MNKNMKKELDMQYDDIYIKSNAKWQWQKRSKNKELVNDGLWMSGIAQSKMANLVSEIILQSNNELEELLNSIEDKYNRNISKKELHFYFEKSKKNVEGHISLMYNDLEIMFAKDSMEICESVKTQLNDLKLTANAYLDKIEQKINYYNKGKSVGKLVIINMVISILGLIVTIAGVAISFYLDSN